MQIIFTLLVLLVILTAGITSRIFNILEKNDTKSLSAYVFYYALPSLFIVRISEIDIWNIDLRIILIAALPIIFLLFFLFILRIFNILEKNNFILLSLSVGYGSTTFFGIPFFQYMFGDKGIDFIVMISALLSPIGIITSILLFEYATHTKQGQSLWLKFIKNPLIISISLGIAFALAQIKIDFFLEALSFLGETTGPIAIFILGMFVYDNFSSKIFKKALPYALFRIISFPLVMYGILWILGDSFIEFNKMLLLQSGIPAATALAVFAERYNYKKKTISGIVIITSMASFVVLWILFYLL